MNLLDLGWSDERDLEFSPHAAAGLQPGRVVRDEREHCLIWTAGGAARATPAGRLRREPAARPVVGDWVAARVERDAATVHAVLARTSTVARKSAGSVTHAQIVAANIDWLWVITGLDGDFNLRRIERYLTVAWDSGAAPVIILNKADLCDDLPQRVAEVEAVALGVPVHALSAQGLAGDHALRPYLQRGRTVALVGSSGVGKSTLINSLLGEARQDTQAVRRGDDHGRHTTTWRELFVLPEGGVIIDTPGMREIQLWADASAVDATFSDIGALSAACRFRDCAHHSEPGCAVLAAVDDGTLDAARLASYHKQRRELHHLVTRQDHRARQDERARWRVIHKHMRKNTKRTGQ